MSRKRIREKSGGARQEKFGQRFIQKFSPDTALEICSRIAEGETLEAICKEPGMPSRVTFWRWRMLYPDLDRVYTLARQCSAEKIEEEALEMARKLRDMKGWKATDVMAWRAAMQQFRWSAERRNPAVYGDRGTSGPSVQVVIQTPLEIGQAEAIDDRTFVLTANLPASGTDPMDLPEQAERLILPKEPRSTEERVRRKLRAALGMEDDE